VQWIPGYWAFDEQRGEFIWVSGFWRVPPPGRQWVPGTWQELPEGYRWSPGFWVPVGQSEVTYLPPPPPSLEIGPATPAPGEDFIYVPGCWVYRERYVWRPGFWLRHRPDLIYVPASYRWTPAGCVFVEGYWDLPLAERGLLFAPVAVPAPVLLTPGFVYTPTYAVLPDAFVGALFVQQGAPNYFFGDYFAPQFRQRGFSAWFQTSSFAIGFSNLRTTYYDPLFSYYGVGFRTNPFWRGGIQELYAQRFAGAYPVPPTTVVQQNTLVKNITNNTIVNNTTINKTIVNNTTVNNVNNATTVNNINKTINQTELVKNVTMVAPVTEYTKQINHFKAANSPVLANAPALTNVPTEARRQEQQAAKELSLIHI